MIVPARFASRRCRGPFWPWAAAAALLLCLGLTGCASPPVASDANSSKSSGLNLMGDGFADNSMGDQVRQYRKSDSDGGFDGVSTKSQQIEKDLGVQ